jgi:spermidine/putrescine transport system substrate-binding protein
MDPYDNRRTVRLLTSPATAGGLTSQLTRRRFLLAAMAAGVAPALLAGCGDDSEPASGGDTAAGVGDRLTMYTWGEYDDPAVLEGFTSEVGPRLQLDTYGSNEEMIAKLVAAKGTSGYDIVVPTGTFVPQMVENGLLEKLDLSRLPNMSNVQEEFLDQAWDPGNSHSVCKAWGTTGYVYDTTVISRELTSWADFLDAAQNEAAGKTTVVDDPKEVLGIALFSEGIDVNTTDEGELAKGEKMLLDMLAPNLTAFESFVGGGAMSEGTNVLLQAWNGDARQGILAEGDSGRWKWVVPTEGSNIWMDNWTIVKGAQHQEAAYAFIDYVLKPDVSLSELAYHGYHTGVKDIEPAAKDAGLERLDMVFLEEEQLGRLVAMTPNEAQERVVDILTSLKAAAGA